MPPPPGRGGRKFGHSPPYSFSFCPGSSQKINESELRFFWPALYRWPSKALLAGYLYWTIGTCLLNLNAPYDIHDIACDTNKSSVNRSLESRITNSSDMLHSKHRLSRKLSVNKIPGLLAMLSVLSVFLNCLPNWIMSIYNGTSNNVWLPHVPHHAKTGLLKSVIFW